MGGHEGDVLVVVQPILCIAHRLHFALCPTLGVGAFADLSEFENIVHGSNYWSEHTGLANGVLGVIPHHGAYCFLGIDVGP